MLVAASLGLATRLVTELTVYMLRCRARLRPCLRYSNVDLVRTVAMTCVRAISACHPGYIIILSLYHCTIEMKLRVNENIIIDSIDELR